MNKAFVCLCEDVTVEELISAIKRGYTNIEDIKRITGIGTGPCQGKQCIQIFRSLVAEQTGSVASEIPLTTLRPPSVPIEFGSWAAKEHEEGKQ